MWGTAQPATRAVHLFLSVCVYVFPKTNTIPQAQITMFPPTDNFPSEFQHFLVEVDRQEQKRIETTVLVAVQRFVRVRTLKYNFLQWKLPKMNAAVDPPDPRSS